MRGVKGEAVLGCFLLLLLNPLREGGEKGKEMGVERTERREPGRSMSPQFRVPTALSRC